MEITVRKINEKEIPAGTFWKNCQKGIALAFAFAGIILILSENLK
jgi:hypothetical protein